MPPFDQELLPGGLRGFVWKENDGGSWVDYAATRDDSTSFILRVIDLHEKYHPHPHPGIDYDPRMRLAVQVWIYEEPNRAYPGERLPEAGWIWVVTPDDPSLRLPKAGERTVAATPSPETP
ncbi:MAG: hypothetical protein M5R36_23150 [Deltaproteobacteria bacterium]|nr:hypothetical protein [Deltaproteobacteria bacterium]